MGNSPSSGPRLVGLLNGIKDRKTKLDLLQTLLELGDPRVAKALLDFSSNADPQIKSRCEQIVGVMASAPRRSGESVPSWFERVSRESPRAFPTQAAAITTPLPSEAPRATSKVPETPVEAAPLPKGPPGSRLYFLTDPEHKGGKWLVSGTMLFTADLGTLAAVDLASGRTRWKTALDSPVMSEHLWDGGDRIAARCESSLSAWRKQDGRLLWRVKMGSFGANADGIAVGDLLARPDKGVIFHSLVTGEPSWTWHPDSILSGGKLIQYGDEEGVLLQQVDSTSHRGDLHWVNPQTTEERWVVPAWPGGDQTRGVIRRGGSLLTWSDAGVREIEVATGKEIVRRPGRYRRAEVTKDVLVLVLDFSFRVTPRASEEMIWEGKSSQFLGAQGDSCYWRRNSAYGCSEAQTGMAWSFWT